MNKKQLVFIGGLNREAPYFQGARGVGLSVFSFDDQSLETTLLAEYGGIDNPSYLSVNDDGSRIYANSEIFGWPEGLVTALAFDRATNTLSHINMHATLGSITAHNMITRDGSKLLVSNYAMGDGGPDRSLVVFGLSDDGALTSVLSAIAHVGTGPDPERQERSHAHSLTELKTGSVAVACDLGLDMLIAYRLDPDGSLSRLDELKMAPGSGPRHLALHPDGTLIFVINELNSTICSLRIDGETGAMSLLDTQSAADASQPDVENHCADLQISPDGRFLYGSNRGHDTVVVFSVDAENGKLALIGHAPCGGATPRNLGMSPDGAFVFSANQNADRVTIFRRNEETGELTDTGKAIETGTPMCVKFARTPLA